MDKTIVSAHQNFRDTTGYEVLEIAARRHAIFVPNWVVGQAGGLIQVVIPGRCESTEP